MNNNDNKILSHTTWNCKYHVVFAPKYRRWIFYESHRKEIMDILKELCRWKGVEILEGNMAVDHVHILVMIPPKMSVSGFMGYLKGKSSLIIYQKWGNMKYQYRCREFWCRGYYVDTTGKNTEVIKKYIQNQLKQDKEMMQLAIDFPEAPFRGSKQKSQGLPGRHTSAKHSASKQGLCPKMKNHRLSRWVTFYFHTISRYFPFNAL